MILDIYKTKTKKLFARKATKNDYNLLSESDL